MIVGARVAITTSPLGRAPVNTFCRVMEEAGWPALFVGGAVRSAILGQPIHDIDIATAARMQDVMAIANLHGFAPGRADMDHQSLKLHVGDQIVTVTSFRRDVATDGRRARIEPSLSMHEDARRRDLTVNAVYADHDGWLIDPLGALADIRNRQVRFIGDPATRIGEDRLRILRFFRIAAELGGATLDGSAIDAIGSMAHAVGGLSRERVSDEMMRLLAAPAPASILADMDRTGLLAVIVPNATPHCLRRLERLEGRIGARPSACRRLAALAGDDALTMLRLNRSDASRVSEITRHLVEPDDCDVLASRLGASRAVDIMLVRAAKRGEKIDKDLLARADRAARKRFPVTASDLAPRLAGVALGAELRRLRREWEESGLTRHRSELLSSSRHHTAGGCQ